MNKYKGSILIRMNLIWTFGQVSEQHNSFFFMFLPQKEIKIKNIYMYLLLEKRKGKGKKKIFFPIITRTRKKPK